MSARKIGLTAAAALATLGLVVGGASLANAESGTSTTSSSTSAGTTAPGGAGGASQDTAVTGDELAKVTAAVTAEHSGLTVTEVRMDPDGSYDVLGTEDGSPVFYEVSADLSTITANAGPSGGQDGQAPTGQPPSGSAPSGAAPSGTAPTTAVSASATAAA